MQRLQDAVRLNDMRRAVEQLDADIKDMFHQIDCLHAQRYDFTKALMSSTVRHRQPGGT